MFSDMLGLWSPSIELAIKGVFDGSQTHTNGRVKVLTSGTYLLYAQVRTFIPPPPPPPPRHIFRYVNAPTCIS